MISVTASNGNLTACTVTTPGSGYKVGDYIYPTQSGATGSSCLVTAVSGSGVSTLSASSEQVMGGFLVDSPALPSIVSVVPNNAPQGGTLTGVVITGNLTNWDNTTEAILGAGVTVSNLNVTSPTTATVDLSVSPTAPVGGNSVIMITGAIGQQTVVSGSGFSVTPNAATISVVSPTSCNANAITVADSLRCIGRCRQTLCHYATANRNAECGGRGHALAAGRNDLQLRHGRDYRRLDRHQSHDTPRCRSPCCPPRRLALLADNQPPMAKWSRCNRPSTSKRASPRLLATTPNAGEQDNTFDMQVLGRFTNWGPTTVAQFNNQDLTVNSVNVIDNDNMILNVTVSPWAYVDYGFALRPLADHHHRH